jgi:hypothetical protein
MLSKNFQTGPGALSLLFKEYREAFQGVKRPQHDVDPSSLSKAEVKNKWSYTSTPLMCLHGVVGEIIKRQCNEH